MTPPALARMSGTTVMPRRRGFVGLRRRRAVGALDDQPGADAFGVAGVHDAFDGRRDQQVDIELEQSSWSIASAPSKPTTVPVASTCASRRPKSMPACVRWRRTGRRRRRRAAGLGEELARVPADLAEALHGGGRTSERMPGAPAPPGRRARTPREVAAARPRDPPS